MSTLIHDRISIKINFGISLDITLRKWYILRKMPRVTNTKGPTGLWLPKSEVMFVDMLIS